MDTPSLNIPIIQGVTELEGDYAVWLCDVWGVMHNGKSAFESANDACRRFRQSGGVVVLLTNAPRPAYAVEKGFAGYGIHPEAYDAIATSGDVTHSHLKSGSAQRIFHLGPERDLPLFDGMDVAFSDADNADLVVCSGLFDDTTETPDDYRPMLSDLSARQIPMVCANPDLMVERGELLIYCAGAVAVLYEELGGPVIYAGKPHPPVYDLALQRAADVIGAPVSRSQVLAIGDGLKTDIAGAFRAELDALFVASGLHMGIGDDRTELDSAAVEALFSDSPTRPRAAIPRLAW